MTLSNLLDTAKANLESFPLDGGKTVKMLTTELAALKKRLPVGDWAQTIQACRTHPVCALLHQDPLTARAYTKPRGYQGDAELLDIIYDYDYHPHWQHPVSELGKALFAHTIQGNAPSAVRYRRDYLVSRLDDICNRNSQAIILSVACGHMREALRSQAIKAGEFERFVGLDHDSETLAVLEQDLKGFGVTSEKGSVMTILRGRFDEEQFDFIYAAGLYDYLNDRMAKHLTRKLFQLLRPGGSLLIANYMPDIEDAGYMETFMGWKLIYRTELEMQNLCKLIPAATIQKKHIFPDQTGSLTYLEMQRRQ